MSTPINISASRGAAILGLSSWKTPLQLWLEIMEAREPGFCEKNNYAKPEFEENPAMRWGHAFESAIIELSEQKTGLRIMDRERFFEKGILTCHIDGQFNVGFPIRLHEGKTTSEFYFREHFGEPGTDAVPVEYQIQAQHEFVCTGAEKEILSVLVFPKRVEEWEEMGYIIIKTDNGYRIDTSELMNAVSIKNWAQTLSEMGYFHQYTITPNVELQTLMIKHYSEFWEKNIIGCIPPEPKTYDDIRAICREPVGTIIADDQMQRLVAEYKNITEEISSMGSLGKRKEQLKVMICDYMRNAAKIEDDDSRDKFIMRDATGKKIATYGKNKAGQMYFR